ncbi:heme ABC transporter ATP-binding protein [Roseisolibacter sp. H3M3-2]|uniref:heme ABC transporter ATP-binding protein n=1 Tax=Roseisolibacter sp. H3M3-2 TaxID=3031323 RepID=UPI0023DB0C1A|nr:heme ABC transporter ATP-binding protein [Roseisolibacter sp. H3M3-2]MDF1501408.1 heme ABC transporter ATP-binding protein [Roseisolibacter sp. H3M3-2]
MLTARGVAYAAGGRRLLDDVSASFAPGAVSVVVGPNGAGKSTLVRVLCRELPPAAGEVRYGGRPLGEWSDGELARVRAVLSQSVELAFPLRVWEVVLMGRYPHFAGRPTARDEAACEAAMRYFDVWDWADRSYLTLSGGERQRVQFARVMAQIWERAPGATRYLVLDEPLTFLDIRYQFEFLHRVRELAAAGDLVVVGVVHDLNLAARFADHLVLLAGGRVLADGAPADVLTPDRVEAAFGVRPVAHRLDGRLHLLYA